MHFLWVTATVLLALKKGIAAEPISCYSCSSIPHPADCTFVKKCQSNEICYVSGIVNNSHSGSGQISYNSGCKERNLCMAVVHPKSQITSIRKKALNSACELCCEDHFCNLDLCTYHRQKSGGPRCLSCTSVLSPKECTSVIQCDHDEICYTEQYNSTSPVYYKLGCTAEKNCLGVISPQLVGKRQVNSQRCGQCCRGDNCNYGLCQGNHSGLTLVTDETTKSSDTCVDKSNELCKYALLTHGVSCADPNIRNLCAKTCNTCDNSCVDKASFSCNEVSKAYNVCADVETAKKYCKKFCDYCRVVDGGWSDWSSWSICTTSCGQGKQTRRRSCTNPSPSPLGSPCPGNSSEARSCHNSPCSVDGAWTQWSAWTDCNRKCEIMQITRTRTCTDPTPANGGAACKGISTENVEQICGGTRASCRADGGWGSWSAWGSCRKYCSGYDTISYSGVTYCSSYSGSRSRSRSCNHPAPRYGGADCPGSGSDSRSC